ncbi:MAG: hypothetical protein J5616_05105 [Bacteroidaceae bacterium]|nr:hypothetical protein [Bacteroidaceae bacterium]
MKISHLKATLALLIVATATSCYNLAPENTGAVTSADIYRGEGNVLKIDSLVNYIREISQPEEVEYSQSSADMVKVEYRYNGKHHKNVSISCDLYNIPVVEETGDQKRDSVYRMLDAYYQRKQAKAQQVHDALVSTCKSLSDVVEPSNSNMKEHQDSIEYSIALRGSDTEGTEPADETSEKVNFRHYPYRLPSAMPATSFTPKEHGSFYYEYTPDSAWSQTHELIDKKGLAKLIKPILSQKGIKSRTFRISHDADCTVKPNYRYNENNVPIWWEAKPMDSLSYQPCSETKGTVYTMHSRTQMESVLRQLTEVIWAFLDRHPHTYYDFCPDQKVPEDFPSGVYNQYFSMYQETLLHEDYTIFIHNCRDEYNLLVLDTKGDLWLPVEWPFMKSWKNGKVTPNKKITLTPQQMRDRAGLGRLSMQKGYDVWTEFDKPKKKNEK